MTKPRSKHISTGHRARLRARNGGNCGLQARVGCSSVRIRLPETDKSFSLYAYLPTPLSGKDYGRGMRGASGLLGRLLAQWQILLIDSTTPARRSNPAGATPVMHSASPLVGRRSQAADGDAWAACCEGDLRPDMAFPRVYREGLGYSQVEPAVGSYSENS